ncbi:ATP-grasp domain-containing protein [Aerosakkonemataceae cyanobacterium BLCC-F167]|uniref:ATP-grasp domain-containing protein n=2 Tax=Floridanema TaxID=3396149 RepID=A0ABV4WMY3_9CYAN
MSMLVLSEASDRIPPSASSRDIKAVTEIAKLLGCRVYYIPQDFTICETAENALFHIPKQERETLGVWIGYIPTPERYTAIYNEALRKNIRLLNTPEEHLTVQEFDRAYPKILNLTPESMTITDLAQCQEVVSKLGLPLFVKGTVQSRKARGWKACVANTLAELEILSQQLLNLENRSRGRIIARKLVKLRHVRSTPEGFPLGREYRVFVYQQKVIGCGYYWEGEDPLKKLSTSEESKVIELALNAAKRLEVPYSAIDIGQLEDEKWIVIETGDPQFSGVSQIPLLQLWNEIIKIDKNDCGI